MDHNSIIDRDTFEVYEHAEDYPKAFICDKRISNSIALLNKKGYETYASCSGHYYVNYETTDAHTYILFSKKYEFKDIPDGFTLTQENDDIYGERTSIDCKFSRTKIVNNEEVLKSRYEFETELDNICQKLNDWVEKLPLNKERND